MAKDLFDRVADEARPPAVLGRYPEAYSGVGKTCLH